MLHCIKNIFIVPTKSIAHYEAYAVYKQLHKWTDGLNPVHNHKEAPHTH